MASKYTYEIIKNLLKEFAEKLERWPTQKEVSDNGLGGVLKALYSRKLTLVHFAKELGYETKTKPNGYWKEWDNLEKALRPLVKGDMFPTQVMIIANIGEMPVLAISKYHGGAQEVSKKMGCKLSAFHVTTDGHYVNSSNEYLLDEYLYSRGIEHSVGDLISDNSKHLYDFKIDDNYIEIWGYEQNRTTSKIVDRYNKKRAVKEELYKELDLKLVSIEETIFKRPFKEIEEYFDELISSLGYDITLKEATYDIENTAKHCKFWNKERIFRELKKIANENGDFPNSTKLLEMGRGDLYDAAKRHGGLNYFMEKIGYKVKKRGNGYWNEKTIIKEVKPIIKKLECFPNTRELQAMDRNDLNRAILRNGGFRKFQKLVSI